MAMDVDSPSSHLDLDHVPLAERRCRLLLLRAEPSAPATDRCEVDATAKGVAAGALQEWPGLPRGAQFNPSDSDLLWHLTAKVGIGSACPHPFIGEFIKSLDEEKGFGYTHPQDLPGVKQDGRASYFFHRMFKSYNNENNKYIRWQKIGKPRPVILDGSPQGCKEVFMLYTFTTNDGSPQKTYWRLHQYHIGNTTKDEGELVVSKLFYKLNVNLCEWAGEPIAASAQDASVARNDSREERPAQVGCADMTTGDDIIQGLGIEDDMDTQEGRQEDKHPNHNKISSCKKGLDNTSLDQAMLINNHPEVEEFDHVSLQERYRILSANKRSCSSSLNAMVCAENCGINGLEEDLCKPVHARATGFIPKSESEKINHKGKAYGQDIYSIMQEISAAPPIVGSISEGDTGRLQDEDLPDIQISPREYFVDSITHRNASNTLGDSILNSTVRVISHCSESSANGQNNLVVQCGLSQQTHVTGENANPLCRTLNLDMSRPHLCVKAEESTNNNNSETNGATRFTADNSGLLSISGSSSAAAPFLYEVRNCHDSSGNTEHQENDKILDLQSLTVSSDAELPRSSLISYFHNGNIQLLWNKPSTCLVDVKLESSWEGNNINFTESTLEKSHFSSENVSLMDSTSIVPECLSKGGQMDVEPLHSKGNLIQKSSADYTDVLLGSSAVGCIDSLSSEKHHGILAADNSEVKSTHAKDPVPPVVVKCELNESDFSGLYENNPLNISKPNRTIRHARSVNLGEDTVYCSRRRKRRKTATDSVETALEEDAPGLLQLLLNRGITAEEIKLYGVEEEDEVLPDCTESDFEDLETVITKLFSQRASLLKFSTARHAKGAKAVYCLACLISLIEQTRYLQFRDTPVEWGWCRDLQSFIFVFKSHNRIVLERPEYGYATYFFEVVQSLPVEWQIRRLVTAMKLTSCGRTTLIENKPLLVGEDLTEGEAEVLEEYGWTPNTGLGTMLNYCDRVVHDRRSETYSSEWRVKIGKILMNGFVGGRSILTIPKKIGKLAGDDNTEIKLENTF